MAQAPMSISLPLDGIVNKLRSEGIEPVQFVDLEWEWSEAWLTFGYDREKAFRAARLICSLGIWTVQVRQNWWFCHGETPRDPEWIVALWWSPKNRLVS